MIAQLVSLANDPAMQTGIQGVGAAAVFWVLGELRSLGKRLGKIETKLKIDAE